MGLLDKILSGTSKAQEAGAGLDRNFACDRTVTLASVPETLEELKAAVDVTDPGSVCAYWLYSVMALTGDYDTGMSMMKYLFADIEPYGAGFTEGGNLGTAGFDSSIKERLYDDDYKWLPRAYFKGASAENGFKPPVPLSVELHYNATNTEASNAQTASLSRTNVVYWLKSNACGNQFNVTLSRFAGSDRWYVTSGSSSAFVFYDQRAALTPEVRAKLYT